MKPFDWTYLCLEVVINTYQSAGEATRNLAQGTHHLIAMVEKRGA